MVLSKIKWISICSIDVVVILRRMEDLGLIRFKSLYYNYMHSEAEFEVHNCICYVNWGKNPRVEIQRINGTFRCMRWRNFCKARDFLYKHFI